MDAAVIKLAKEMAPEAVKVKSTYFHGSACCTLGLIWRAYAQLNGAKPNLVDGRLVEGLGEDKWLSISRANDRTEKTIAQILDEHFPEAV